MRIASPAPWSALATGPSPVGARPSGWPVTASATLPAVASASAGGRPRPVSVSVIRCAETCARTVLKTAMPMAAA